MECWFAACNLIAIARFLKPLIDAREKRLAADLMGQRLARRHSDVADSLSSLAVLYYNQGQYAKAEPLYHRALAIREKVLGPEHLDVANNLNNLAGLYYNQGQYPKAELLMRRALVILEKALGPEHLKVAPCLENYAFLLRDMVGARQKQRPEGQAARSPTHRNLNQQSRRDPTTVAAGCGGTAEQGTRRVDQPAGANRRHSEAAVPWLRCHAQAGS